MQIHQKFDSLASARNFASTAVSLAEMEHISMSRRAESRKEMLTCQDPRCKAPDTFLSRYNVGTVVENGRRIRICNICRKRRRQELLAKLGKVSSLVGERKMQTATAKIAKLLGFHPTAGRSPGSWEKY